MKNSHVIPAQAGIQCIFYIHWVFVSLRELGSINWIPACAGMTMDEILWMIF